MDVAAAVVLIEGELRAAGDPERAVNERRYLKSDLVHLGVPMPVIRRIVAGAVRARPDRAELLELVERLWTATRTTADADADADAAAVTPAAAAAAAADAPVHELRMVAIELLVRWVRVLEIGDAAVAERLIRESHGWAYVDVIAAKVVGDLLGRFPEIGALLDRWAADDDFWIRRTALLALLPGIRAGDADLDRLSRYGEAMVDESEFFIRKALGWVLRELSKRDPAWVRDWVSARIDRVSGVTVREVVRYLSESDGQALLAAYRSR